MMQFVHVTTCVVLCVSLCVCVLCLLVVSLLWPRFVSTFTSCCARAVVQLSHHISFFQTSLRLTCVVSFSLGDVQSDETSGPITGVALASLQKCVASLIDARSARVAHTMHAIGYAVTHCRFEATDPDSDEVVLMKILHVLRACVRGSAGRLISDDMVYEMVQTCFRMAFQSRLSELLRKTAEQTLLDVLLVVFARYGEYDEERAARERAVAERARAEQEAADAARADTAKSQS